MQVQVMALKAIQRIGATAKSRLSVSIVGTTIEINANVEPIAPKPTVMPPKQPTINMTIEIQP